MTRAQPESSVNPPPTVTDDDWMDDSVAPFRMLVQELAVFSEPLIGPPMSQARDAPREGMYVERMALTLPFELDLLVQEDGSVQLAGTPPTQYTRTSVMPVFHSMSLRVTGTLRDG